MKRPLLSVLLALVWSLPAMATEEPAYTVIERDGPFEVRDYAPMVVAETVIREDFESAGNAAFRPLFGYISGKNRGKEQMAMTAPVRQETDASGGFRVGFIAPAQYSFSKAPAPDNPGVVLREIPAQRMAVLRYSGRWTEQNYREHEAKLREWTQRHHLTAAGPMVYARYNAPFVPWPLRRNEVMMPIAVR